MPATIELWVARGDPRARSCIELAECVLSPWRRRPSYGRSTGRALALIEIEETNDNPKKVIGDVFGVLLGDKVTFKGTDFHVGPWTTLIVLGKGPVGRRERNGLITGAAQTAQAGMQSRNHAVGEIVVESIADMAELPARLRELVEVVLRRDARA